MRYLRRALPGLVIAGGILAAGPASAQLVFDRLALIPQKVQTGPGTTRLDGMGGFETAVADENLEINLNDFSNNPAGYGDDRDSWSIDFRYSHGEYAGATPVVTQNDVRVNDGSFSLGYHSPGKVGLGGTLDYAEAKTRDVLSFRNDFHVVGFGVTGSKYLFPRLTAGLLLSRGDETEDTFTTSIYDINHKTTTTRGVLGLGYRVARGVMLGVRGEGFRNSIDGTSSGVSHTDVFTWKRPGTIWSVQGFVDRGRLQAGVDYGSRRAEGKESVRLSWSERFIFNPTNGPVSENTDTFSEDRTTHTFRARASLNVVPGRIAVSGAGLHSSDEFKVVINPNAIGSLPEQNVKSSASSAVGGVSWTGAQQRLLLAGEVKTAKSDFTTYGEDDVTKAARKELTLRVGGEYLLTEQLSGRLGLIRTHESFTEDLTPVGGGATNSTDFGGYNTTRLAVGLGVVPLGAIWQLDLAYDAVLSTDLNTHWSELSAYVRHLF